MKSPNDADFEILSLANDAGKIAVGLDMVLTGHVADAFERGLGEWFVLIDVAPVATAGGQICRVFRLTESGHARLAQLRQKRESNGAAAAR